VRGYIERERSHLSAARYRKLVILYVTFVLVLSQFGPHKADGDSDDSRDSARRAARCPGWAIGTSLIAANISAEQITHVRIGLKRSVWPSPPTNGWPALVILIVGKFFCRSFLKNQIYTMPEFLRRRYGRDIQLVMASFWLILLRVREPDGDPVAGRHRGPHGHRPDAADERDPCLAWSRATTRFTVGLKATAFTDVGAGVPC